MFRFLIVDDNADDALLLSHLIEQDYSKEASCQHATSLLEALEWLDPRRHQPFDALLLDLNLGDSHGLETFRIVRSAFPVIPIVIWSGRDDERGTRDLLIDEGAAGYLEKGTVSPKQVFEELRDAARLAGVSTRIPANEKQVMDEVERRALAFVNETRKDKSIPPMGREALLAEAFAGFMRQQANFYKRAVMQTEAQERTLASVSGLHAIVGELKAEVSGLKEKDKEHDDRIDDVERTGRHTVAELGETKKLTKENKRKLAGIGAAIAGLSYVLGELREPIMELIKIWLGGS